MPTIWKQTHTGFVALPLEAIGHTDVSHTNSQVAAPPRLRIIPFRDGNRPAHVLIADPGVPIRVNGCAVVGGIRVLQHKDELLVGSQCMFYSAESTPVADVYRQAGAQRRPRCPVCRAKIQDGDSVVRCPGCSRIYHQCPAIDDGHEKPCWSYSPTCRFCEHPTSMSGEPTWRPAEEEQ